MNKKQRTSLNTAAVESLLDRYKISHKQVATLIEWEQEVQNLASTSDWVNRMMVACTGKSLYTDFKTNKHRIVALRQLLNEQKENGDTPINKHLLEGLEAFAQEFERRYRDLPAEKKRDDMFYLFM